MPNSDRAHWNTLDDPPVEAVQLLDVDLPLRLLRRRGAARRRCRSPSAARAGATRRRARRRGSPTGGCRGPAGPSTRPPRPPPDWRFTATGYSAVQWSANIWWRPGARRRAVRQPGARPACAAARRRTLPPVRVEHHVPPALARLGRSTRASTAPGGPLAVARLPVRHRRRARPDELPVRGEHHAACGRAGRTRTRGRCPAPSWRPPGTARPAARRRSPPARTRGRGPARDRGEPGVDHGLLRLPAIPGRSPSGPGVGRGEVRPALVGVRAVVDHRPAEPLVPRDHGVPEHVRADVDRTRSAACSSAARPAAAGSWPSSRSPPGRAPTPRPRAAASGRSCTPRRTRTGRGTAGASRAGSRSPRRAACAPPSSPRRPPPARPVRAVVRVRLGEVGRLQLRAAAVDVEVRSHFARSFGIDLRMPVRSPRQSGCLVRSRIRSTMSPGSITVQGITAAIVLPGPAMPSTSARRAARGSGSATGDRALSGVCGSSSSTKSGRTISPGRERLERCRGSPRRSARRRDHHAGGRHHAVGAERPVLRPVRRRRHGREDDRVADHSMSVDSPPHVWPVARLAIPARHRAGHDTSGKSAASSRA
jgi:hypothetical protein